MFTGHTSNRRNYGEGEFKYYLGLSNFATLQLQTRKIASKIRPELTVQFVVIEHNRKELQKVDYLAADSTGNNEAMTEL